MVTVGLWAIEVKSHQSEIVAGTIEKSSANRKQCSDSLKLFSLGQSTFGVRFAEIFDLSTYESADSFSLKPD